MEHSAEFTTVTNAVPQSCPIQNKLQTTYAGADSIPNIRRGPTAEYSADRNVATHAVRQVSLMEHLRTP
jgi:hypothetical protein